MGRADQKGALDNLSVYEKTFIYPAEAVLVPVLQTSFTRSSLKRYVSYSLPSISVLYVIFQIDLEAWHGLELGSPSPEILETFSCDNSVFLLCYLGDSISNWNFLLPCHFSLYASKHAHHLCRF